MSETTDLNKILVVGLDRLTAELRASLEALGAEVLDADAVITTENLDEDLVLGFAPIDTPGGPLSQITVSEPTAAQTKLWSSLKGTEAEIMAVATCAGVLPAVVEKLKARPFRRAVRRVEAFLA